MFMCVALFTCGHDTEPSPSGKNVGNGHSTSATRGPSCKLRCGEVDASLRWVEAAFPRPAVAG